LILGDGLVVVEGEEHKFQRKNATPAFSFRHIKDLYPIFWSKSAEMAQLIAAEIRNNLDRSADEKSNNQGVVEINHWSNKATMDIIGVAGLGKDFNALNNPEDELIKMYEELLEPTREKGIYFALSIIPFGRRLVAMLPWRLNDRLKTTTGKLRKYCLDLIRDKKQNIKVESEEKFDILSLLIKSNNFSDENLVDQLLTFLAAG
jgi:cytochrome P450